MRGESRGICDFVMFLLSNESRSFGIDNEAGILYHFFHIHIVYHLIKSDF